MPVVSYHSTTFDKASAQEAVDTTSSQIFLSRGVADSNTESSPAVQNTPSSVTAVFESSSKHIMTLGDAPRASTVFRSQQRASADEESYCRYDSFVHSLQTSRRVFATDGESPLPLSAPEPSIRDRPIATSHFTEEPENGHLPDGYRVVNKGKGKEVERGRTLEKGPRVPNPLAAAESRKRRDEAAIELDVRQIGKRPSRSSTFFEDPSDPCAVMEDNMLEPCPRLSMCSSLSDILISSVESLRPRSKTDSSALVGEPAIEKPTRALTTVFKTCRTESPSPTLPRESHSHNQPNICQLEHLAMNSYSNGDYTSKSVEKQQKQPEPAPALAADLPTEVVQQFFYNLHPTDFNAARHACRSWFISSLERSILETMLRRGGWSANIPREIGSNYAFDEEDEINEEWQMSMRISRECALSSEWTGNGLRGQRPSSSGPSAFVHISTVDFTDVAVHYPGINLSSTVFTVSSCGKFLMAANGCLIYVYELNKSCGAPSCVTSISTGSLRPVTSILCPRRVIACSMDTSSHRYAIAVLLDGRMGLVCDISPSSITASSRGGNRSDVSEFSQPPEMGSPTSSTNSRETTSRASFLDRIALNSSSANLGTNRTSSEPPFVLPGIATTPPMNGATPDDFGWQDVSQGSVDTVRTEGPSSRQASLSKIHVLSPGSRTRSILPPQVKKEPGTSSMPIETGPRSLYRNLCSEDDPPRSVAICPQRRCVAFGCSAGIELHWVDALTGQDLNRWFPLTAPSDYLFFLPPRKSVDSAKKLRLISSAARPGERAAISDRAFGGRARNSPFWEKLGWGAGVLADEEVANQTQSMISTLRNEVRSRGLSGRMDYSDHYRAIPLSDGYHILFTDPSTGLLCLGSDAPVGGPTKLLRKIWFQGPEGEGSPVAYAGGSDLKYGVRVVAAFGSSAQQRIFFFSVPGDVFAADQGSQTNIKGSWLKSSSSCITKNLEWMNWWPEDGLQDWVNHSRVPVPGILPRSVWPVKIKGQELGMLPGLIDLALDSGPGMNVWALSKEGLAKVWQLDAGRFDGSVKERLVARDGTMRDLDGEGDVEMRDSLSTSPEILAPSLNHPSDSFDGSASFYVANAVPARVDKPQSRQNSECIYTYDAEGDVFMEHIHSSEDEDGIGQVLNEVLLAQAGQLVYETFQRSERYNSGQDELDFVEHLTGISRLDIEIR